MRTTITVSEEVWSFLKTTKNLGETHDDVIRKLIAYYLKKNKQVKVKHFFVEDDIIAKDDLTSKSKK